jgi:hypothetical protein
MATTTSSFGFSPTPRGSPSLIDQGQRIVARRCVGESVGSKWTKNPSAAAGVVSRRMWAPYRIVVVGTTDIPRPRRTSGF